MKAGYCSNHLSNERLRRCYELASPRVRRYLEAEIDREQTGNGIIACRDGFRSGRLTPEMFLDLGRQVGIIPRIAEIDESAVLCEFSN